ncbi:MAG: DUF3108 domain-containing protein [Bacteroidota bacterium]
MRKKVIKTGFFFAFLTMLMAFSYPIESTLFEPLIPAQLIDVEPCYVENNAFQDGEEITYKLYYNWNFIWLAAGEVTFRVEDLGDKLHLSAYGRTYKSYEWFFKVRDNYDTYVDKETLLPIESVRDINEGKYTLYDKVMFEQDQNLAKSLRGRSKETAKLSEYRVDACMHDILSIVYFTRNLNFDGMETGKRIPIKIFMDEEVWPLQVAYKGKHERKKIKGNGRWNTIKFSPEVISGQVFNEGTEMNVWASADENKIPLLIESPVSVGSVKAVLKSYKGLKYEQTSKVKK